jgi:hypothetical protein
LFGFRQQFTGTSLDRAEILGFLEDFIVDTLCTAGLKKAIFTLASFKKIRFLASGKVNDKGPILDVLRIRVSVFFTCGRKRRKKQPNCLNRWNRNANLASDLFVTFFFTFL